MKNKPDERRTGECDVLVTPGLTVDEDQQWNSVTNEGDPGPRVLPDPCTLCLSSLLEQSFLNVLGALVSWVKMSYLANNDRKHKGFVHCYKRVLQH
jgi:hypothetical protein